MHLLYIDPHPVPDVCPEAMQILQTVDALAQVGCRVTLATPAAAAGQQCEAVLGRPLHEGVEIVRLRDLRAQRWLPIRSGKFFYREAVSLVKKMKGIDGILVRNLKLAEALIPLPSRPPLVFETHEVFARTFAEDHPSPSWKERRKLSALRKREGGVYAGSQGLAALTPWLLEDIREEYAVTTPGVVVPDGVDPGQAEGIVGKQGWHSPPVLLYLGSLHPWKGLDCLLSALAMVDACELHIAGGPEARIAELKAQAAALGIAQRVRFLGSVPPQQRFQTIADADICLLPLSATAIGSRYTSPLKLFEYMAVGKPIIAADVPALRLVIRNEEDGLLARVGEPAAFAAQIQRLISDPALAVRMGQAARARVEDFTWTARAAVLRDFFAGLKKGS